MSRKSKSEFEAARQLVKDHPVSYAPVTFPMTHIEDGLFRFSNGQIYPLAPIGAGYLRERLRDEGVTYGQLTKLLKDGKYEELAHLTSKYAAKLEGEYIAAVYDDRVVGLMTKYNPVSHADLLALIKSLKLEDKVVNSHIDDYGFYMDLQVEQRAAGYMQTFLRCYNGHSGHYALSYKAVFMIEGYEFPVKLQGGRSRHLSTVQALVDNLEASLVEVQGLKLVGELAGREASWALTVIANNVPMTVTRERLLAALPESVKTGTALELVEAIGAYSSSRGWASAVQGLLDPVLKEALDS